MIKRVAAIFTLIAGITCYLGAAAYAESLRSPNYQVDESFVGSGGDIQSSSPNYQVGESIGNGAASGGSSSANFQANAGYTTTNDPALSFAIISGDINFGSFSPSSASVTTSTFQVSNYTSYGYAVQIVGTPPRNGNRTLAAMNTAGPSQAGTEQFGINLVANTSPVSVGANPDQGQFGFGTAAANYNTSNQYRYVSGDTIASAPKSSGITTYTISYLVNVSSLTPGGKYTTNQTLICTGTY